MSNHLSLVIDPKRLAFLFDLHDSKTEVDLFFLRSTNNMVEERKDDGLLKVGKIIDILSGCCRHIN